MASGHPVRLRRAPRIPSTGVGRRPDSALKALESSAAVAVSRLQPPQQLEWVKSRGVV